MENYIIANCTDTGRTRSLNEDSMITFDSPNGRVVVVCDGLGGQNAGEVASQLAVKVIQDILTDNTFNTPEEAIKSSINAANQAILHRASQDPNCSGMGSTCVMIIIRDSKVYYGSVGDSRLYYAANHMIRQITKDQSYVQTLVDEGTISEEAAEHHQDKNQIMNALGLATMKPAVIGSMPITPEPGSCFILCSDGLSGMISNNVILNTVSRHELSLQERAKLLVKQANDAGGQDNITVQLVEFPASGSNFSGSNAVMVGGVPTTGRKKGNTVAYVIISLFILAMVGVGVYWFFLREEPQKKPNKVESTIKTRNKQRVVKERKETERVIVVEEKKEVKNDSPVEKIKKKKTNTIQLKREQPKINKEEEIIKEEPQKIKYEEIKDK